MSDTPPQVPPPDGPQQPGWSSAPPPPPGQYPPAYEPSAGAPGPAAGPVPAALAGFWIRFVGALLDGILLGIVGNVLGAVFGVEGFGGSGVGFVLGAVYFTYFHASGAAQTLGQKAVNIRIADVNTGGGIDYGRAFLRFLMSYVSGIALLLGYLWMLWDPKKQTWHDKVANTLVVRTSHYPPPGAFGKPAS